MEHLNELSLGIRGENTGQDHPPVASLAMADHTASLSDMLQASFDVL